MEGLAGQEACMLMNNRLHLHGTLSPSRQDSGRVTLLSTMSMTGWNGGASGAHSAHAHAEWLVLAPPINAGLQGSVSPQHDEHDMRCVCRLEWRG